MTSDARSRIAPELQQAMEDQPEQALPVLIELSAQVGAEIGLDRGEQLAKLDAAVRTLQSGVVDELRKTGVSESNITRLTLANAIAAPLTARQIEAIAEREDVRVIRFNREFNVALQQLG